MRQDPIPKVVIVRKPVDDGRGMIGVLECPHCGETHYTAILACGLRNLFCGKSSDGRNIIQRVEVTAILS